MQKLSKDNQTETRKYEKILNLNAIQQYPVILYNYALVYNFYRKIYKSLKATLQIGKYDEATEAYSSLAEFWPDNAKVPTK